MAGETEAAVDKALKLIKVKYKVLPAVLDFHKAKDNEILIHPEDNWELRCLWERITREISVPRRKRAWEMWMPCLKECKYVVDRTYHTKANQQTMMETFRAYTYLDHFGRLNVVASTQVPFHVRRILGRALGIGASKVRVIKPGSEEDSAQNRLQSARCIRLLWTMKTGKRGKDRLFPV